MSTKHKTKGKGQPDIIHDPTLDEYAKNRKPSSKLAKANETITNSNLIALLNQRKKK